MELHTHRVIPCIVIVFLMLLLVAVSGCGQKKEQEKKKTAKAVQAEKVPRSLTAKGIVESKEELEIRSQIAEVIVEIPVAEGTRVRKGQLLVRFDDSKIRARMQMAEAQLAEARARLQELKTGFRGEETEAARSRLNRAEAMYTQAKDEYERLLRLYQKDAATKVELNRAEERMNVALSELNEAKANLQKFEAGSRKEEIRQASAAVERALSELNYYKAQLKDYTIYSPINGMVVEKFREVGEAVTPGTPILRLINPDALRILAQVEESDVGRVTEGQRVEVSSDAYKDKQYNGSVYQVIPALKRKSQRTFDPSASFDIIVQEVYIRLDDFSGLRPGMTVTVRFLK